MGVGFPDKRLVKRSAITEGGHLSTTAAARFELHWETRLAASDADQLRVAIRGGDDASARQIIEGARQSLTDRETQALRITFENAEPSQDPGPAEPLIHFEHFEDHDNDGRATAGWRVEAVGRYPEGTGPESDPLQVLSSALEMDPPLDPAAQDMIRALVDHLRSELHRSAE